MTLNGHGVGMSGCGAEGQANDGKTGEQILSYYYPGAVIMTRY
jgi:SpoIID/LytB domain protein